MKKILSLTLALIMVLCCIPNIVFAKNGALNTKRYTVLVLDTSSTSTFIGSAGNEIYTADTALEYVQRASSRFLSNISAASGDNYVAVVSYKDYATTLSDFSKDYGSLISKINDLTASSNTRDISSGLSLANDILSDIKDENAIKNVVLFTTGMTNEGTYSYSGHYNENTIGSKWKRTDTKVKLYAYANVAYEQAALLKEKDISLYTISLFQTMENMPEEGQDIAEFFKLTALDLATSEDYFYPVDDPDKLEFTFGEVADDIMNAVKEITFTYQSGNDYTATCYYTNDYFSKSSYTYDPSLATMSLSFAMSAFGSSEGGQTNYTDKSKNAKQLLRDIGIEDKNIETNEWFTVKPTTDSIGVVAGNMPITVNGETYTLIALAVRGGGYEQEWASNFTIGNSGQHSGFDTAKNNVISFLKSYISNQNITGPVKLWITGYSRAAATSNLVAGAIDNGTSLSSSISYGYDDVYAYCFETPAGALTSQVKNKSVYYNIFNIINSSDPVPYVAPAALGFGRYGVDRYLPSAESDPDNYASQKTAMLKTYESLPSTKTYVVDNFQMKKIGVKNWLPGGKRISLEIQDDLKNNYSQGVFLSNYVTILAKDFIGNRSNYVDNYEDTIRLIFALIEGFSEEQSDIIWNSFSTQAKNNWHRLVLPAISSNFSQIIGAGDATDVVFEWLSKSFQDAGITNYNNQSLKEAASKLTALLLGLIVSHPNYATTLAINLNGIKAAHYPELCFSWLASMDSNYKDGAKVILNNGGYRIIRINCEVDINVCDSNGTIVASIINDSPQIIDKNNYIFGIDMDGQKYVVLPINSAYEITITGRENDLVNLGISEYSACSGDYTRNVNYFNVELNKGKSLTGIIPSYSDEEINNDTPNGSTVNYILLDSDNNQIDSSSDLSGSEATSSYFNVTATSSNPNYGLATGSGMRQYGQFAQLEAVALDGHKFIGWYKGGLCVSTDEIYRVCVVEDIELVAKFEVDTIYDNTEIQNTKDTNSNINNAKDTSKQIAPQTSDNRSITLWIILLFVSFFTIIGFRYKNSTITNSLKK